MPFEINIKKKLGSFELDIDFSSQTKRLGILGASGSGKSMLLKCIAGIVSPDTGRISVGGRVLFDSAKHIHLTPQKRNIGYLFQNYALFPTMTVERNILAAAKGSKAERKRKTDEILKRFGIDELRAQLPSQLSGGQQQRTAFARMSASEPSVMLLDEPFSALDVYLKDRLHYETLKLLEVFPGEAVLVSHDRDEIYKFSDEVLIIDKGKAVSCGNTKEVFEDPQTAAAARLTGCKNISRIERIGKHEVRAVDWGLTLRTEKAVGDEITQIGIRAHDLRGVEHDGENVFKPEILTETESPFEVIYTVRSEGNGEIWWKAARDERKKNDFPAYLYMPPESLLLLK
jgi:molybdate transport system ATP-binding protein